MIKSIQQFQEKGVKKLEEVFVNYSGDMTKFAEMVYGVRDEVINLGLSMIAEELEFYDESLRKKKELRTDWYIVRRDETTLLTSIGNVTYQKTLFKNKHTGKYEYLLDRVMGIEKHTRITEDAKAKILEEAVESSYRKGGDNVSITTDKVSKETVMNKIHALEFPKVNVSGEKKKVKYLYIDADEDHVSLQYMEKKGDIGKDQNNTIMTKLIYVYEGIRSKNGRNELINRKNFGGLYEGTQGVQELWKAVQEYIEEAYDTDELERIYINGDGANWIKTGKNLLSKSAFVMDKFHMHKYIIHATSHLKDSAEDARSEIYRAIYKKSKKEVRETFEKIENVTETGSKLQAVQTAKEYLLNNWTGIMVNIKVKDENLKCSAEGHVSHIYADRMSSRPLGWSKKSVDKMSRLRIYRENKGSMLELVRYQKQDKKLAAGCEEVIYMSHEMFAMERKNRKALGYLADIPVYTIPYPQIKKIANFKNHIYGL